MVIVTTVGLVGHVTIEAAQTTVSTEQTMGISPLMFFVIILVVCMVIGIVAVIGGVGGGVIFTPLLLGFTPIDSYIVRTTGMLVAMAGTLIASRTLLRNGVANMKLMLISVVPYSVFTIIGALGAGFIHATTGVKGEAVIKVALGVIVIAIGLLFVFSRGRTEWPEGEKVDGFSKRMTLSMGYWEASLSRVVNYKVTRAGLGIVLLCGVGLVSGFFGLGAGWAMVPVYNLVMLAPLKVAAATSTVLISVGDSAGVWTYINGGGMFPLFAVPAMMGFIAGSYLGAQIMVRVQASFVRRTIIAIMFLAGFRLILKGVSILG